MADNAQRTVTHTRLAMLEYPHLKLHNNLSENDIREYVRLRKINAGTRSDQGRGTTAAERFYGTASQDLFGWLLNRVAVPARPRCRRRAA